MSNVLTLATVADGVTIAFDPDSSMVYPLTGCCKASAKGLENYVGCRACYQPIPDGMGMAWIFKPETTDENVAENEASTRSLTSWIEEFGGGPLSPTIAYTITLEAIRAAR